MVSGGQVLTTYEVDNYPGLPGIGGYDLGIKFREHADRLGARFVEDEVLNIQDGGKGAIKGVVCQGNTYEARSLILATGAVHRKLGVPGEEELAGAGVSYCATCDGAFFRNKVTAVIGGGDVAVEDAIFLARMCSKVYLIHRRNELRPRRRRQPPQRPRRPRRLLPPQLPRKRRQREQTPSPPSRPILRTARTARWQRPQRQKHLRQWTARGRAHLAEPPQRWLLLPVTQWWHMQNSSWAIPMCTAGQA